MIKNVKVMLTRTIFNVRAGKYNYISLGNNQLKRLESNVFKTPMMKGSTVDIRGSNKT